MIVEKGVMCGLRPERFKEVMRTGTGARRATQTVPHVRQCIPKLQALPRRRASAPMLLNPDAQYLFRAFTMAARHARIRSAGINRRGDASPRRKKNDASTTPGVSSMSGRFPCRSGWVRGMLTVRRCEGVKVFAYVVGRFWLVGFLWLDATPDLERRTLNAEP
jgi:hypothetical protein